MPLDTINTPQRGAALPATSGKGSLSHMRAAAWLSGAFTLAVALMMLVSHISARNEDPLNSPQLKDLKEQLRAAPTDEQLKTRIRALDLELRERYFKHISQLSSGVWLLLAGAGIFACACAQTVAASKKPFLPLLRRLDPTAHSRQVRFSRFAVSVTGAAFGAGVFWLTTVSSKSVLPRSMPASAQPATAEGTPVAAGPDCASPEQLANEWPGFRGYSGSGVALSSNAPLSWDVASGSGVLWKVESPVPGFNSPLVFEGHVYISGGDASKIEVISLRLSDGQLAWRQAVQRPPAAGEPAEIPESTGYAPSTMATDGRRVYAIFADGNLGAFTLDGKPAWFKSFGSLKNAYGHATSLATWKDRLIVQLDQGDSEEGKSMLYALDGRTGRPVWQRPRKLGASWASPIVIEAAGKPQIITLSLPWVISYSAADGSELWRVDCLNGEVTPSPIFAGGFVIIASPSDRILAIRPDGAGDITKSNVVWSFDENIPDVTSPVSNGELVFMVTTSGTLTCVDIKDGKKVWDHELEMECHASPTIAGDRLYQLGQDGTAVVLQAGREYKELFRGKMPDSFHASPAFVSDKMVLRGVTNIWCLGASKGGAN